ncbi:hypothetical protein [Frankia gtarii]|uniref:hypothetical protein n=1 Tax=Frankia gtarii TaxID=2950102 RepID=UPI0021C09049|nr:hypothetical protein [Frankia gtarii]
MSELEVSVLRVFADETGAGGSLLAVILDAGELLADPRDRALTAHRQLVDAAEADAIELPRPPTAGWSSTHRDGRSLGGLIRGGALNRPLVRVLDE